MLNRPRERASLACAGEQSSPADLPQRAEEQVDEETLERLRALGYVD
jgi:hypothetical protein